MSYQKFHPSQVDSGVKDLFYSEDLIPAIEVAHEALLAMDDALKERKGFWELAALTRRVVVAHHRLIQNYGLEHLKGRHRMPKHIYADLMTVIVANNWVFATARVEEGNAAWHVALGPALAPGSKRFRITDWGRRCLSRFTAARKPAKWTPNTPRRFDKSFSPKAPPY